VEGIHDSLHISKIDGAERTSKIKGLSRRLARLSEGRLSTAGTGMSLGESVDSPKVKIQHISSAKGAFYADPGKGNSSLAPQSQEMHKERLKGLREDANAAISEEDATVDSVVNALLRSGITHTLNRFAAAPLAMNNNPRGTIRSRIEFLMKFNEERENIKITCT